MPGARIRLPYCVWHSKVVIVPVSFAEVRGCRREDQVPDEAADERRATRALRSVQAGELWWRQHEYDYVVLFLIIHTRTHIIHREKKKILKIPIFSGDFYQFTGKSYYVA